MIREILLQFCLFFLLYSPCFSQTVCRGDRRRILLGSFDEVLVDGNVTRWVCFFAGNAQKVTVINGGRFVAIGSRTRIAKIHATGARDIGVAGGARAGDVFAVQTNRRVVVGRDGSVERLFMEDSGRLDHFGFIGTLTSRNSGNINITEGVIGNSQPNAMVIQNGQQEVTLCNATIAGIQTKNSSLRVIAANRSNCAHTNILSLYSVGPGTVTVKGVTLTGKVSLSAYNVEEVKISSTTVLGGVGTRFISGALSLINVFVGGTVSLHGSQKSTRIEGSEFKGIVTVGATERSARRASESSISTSVSRCTFERSLTLGPSSGKINISESKFSKQRVHLAPRGSVTFRGNGDVGLLRVRVNAFGVEVADNKISRGQFRSNTGGVELVGNTFETVSCFGNNPAPELVDNIVSKSGAGQCASA